MREFLVICKKTGQSAAFKRVALDYTNKNNIPVNWHFATYEEYLAVLDELPIDLVLISPEVILLQQNIIEDLEGRKQEYFVMKPIDFGLKRMEKLMPSLEKYINNQ